MHGECHRNDVRLQVDSEEEAGVEGGQGGYEEGDSYHAAFVWAEQHCGVQGGVRGQDVGPPCNGTLRRRGAIRPDHRPGSLLRESRRLTLPRHCQRCSHLPLHGSLAPRSQARKFPALF